MNQYNYTKENNARKLREEIKQSSLGLKLVSIITSGEEICIEMNSALTTSEEDELSGIVASHSISYTEQDVVLIIENASCFGKELVGKFAAENVMMGITQVGKTGSVSLYLHNLAHYVTTGSLYEAMSEVDRLIASGLPVDLDPFVTEARLLSYKAKIQAYLG